MDVYPKQHLSIPSLENDRRVSSPFVFLQWSMILIDWGSVDVGLLWSVIGLSTACIIHIIYWSWTSQESSILLPQQQSPTAFKLTPMCLPIDNSRAAPQCRQSPRQSPSTVISDLSALESPRSVSGYYETSSPQDNSSTSPRSTAPNPKAKSEMCKNMLTKGYCSFGSQCHFAHSENERQNFSSVEELYQGGLIRKTDMGVYLNRPCCFWVQSGSWYVCYDWPFLL